MIILKATPAPLAPAMPEIASNKQANKHYRVDFLISLSSFAARLGGGGVSFVGKS